MDQKYLTEGNTLDKEFTFLKNSEGIRKELWDNLYEHKRKFNHANLYGTLDSYVAKLGFSFGVKSIYKGDTDIVVGYSFYINNGGEFLLNEPLGRFEPEPACKSYRDCLNACIRWVLYHIEGKRP